ncbi:MAG: AroM family protein [Thermomicrobiales bacterium]
MTETARTAEILNPPENSRGGNSIRTIGVLTIGQSPRVDKLGDDVRAVLGPRTRVVERGALDGMSDEEIARIAPRDASEYRLVTLLRSGRSVEIGKPAILERLQKQIRDLEDEDTEAVDATLLMCTGAFPPFEHTKPLLLPQEALYGAVTGLAGGGCIGALIPLESQREQSLGKWHERGVTDVHVFPASPYDGDPLAAIERASSAARDAGVSVLFMDCFGYDLAMKSAARRSFGGPVVLARTLAARLIAELSE